MDTASRRSQLVRPDRFEFRGVSREMMLAQSVTDKGITAQATTRDIKNRSGSLYDIRMGPVYRDERCGTCSNKLDGCPGHFGHIELPMPVINPLIGTELAKVLDCFCTEWIDDEANPGSKRLCMRPRFDERKIERYQNMESHRRYTQIAKMVEEESSMCSQDHHTIGKWKYSSARDKRNDSKQHRMDLTIQKETITITPGDLIYYCQYIDNKYLELLGIAWHPKDMIMEIKPVIPNTHRPYETVSGKEAHNSITQLLNILVKRIDALMKDLIEKSVRYGRSPGNDPYKYYRSAELRPFYKNAKYTAMVTALENVATSKYNKESYAKNLKGELDYIEGKQGIFRDTVLAARVGYITRATIVMDPTIRPDQISLPLLVRDKLTKKIVVTPHNRPLIESWIRGNLVIRLFASSRARDKPEKELGIRRAKVEPYPAKPNASSNVLRYLQLKEQDFSSKKIRAELGNIEKAEYKAIVEEAEAYIEQLEEWKREYNRVKEEEDKFVDGWMSRIFDGDSIERVLLTDDIVMVSRQPHLHKESIMAHRVVMKDNLSYNEANYRETTIGLSPTVAAPYAADADGDEMNVFVPQGMYYEAEAVSFMTVAACTISGQANKASIGLIQDAQFGIGALTMTLTVEEVDKDGNVLKDGERVKTKKIYRYENIERGKWMQLVMATGKEESLESLSRRCAAQGVKLFSSRGLASILFPEGFFYEKKNGENIVQIRDGILIRGTLDSSVTGASSNCIHQMLYYHYGENAAIDFLTSAQALGVEFIRGYGHSIGYSSIVLCPETEAELKAVKDRTKAELMSLSAAKKKATNEYDRNKLEREITNVANNLPLELSTILKRRLSATNPWRMMADLGSKGSYQSVAQGIGGAVGQITMQKQRLRGELEGGRTISSQLEGDDNPMYMGMIYNSFAGGKTYVEELSQAYAVRGAQVDIALKTADTGYLARRTKMFLINLATYSDGSIRSTNGLIVQFLAYGDGLRRDRLVRYGNRPKFIDLRNVVDMINFDIASGKQLRKIPRIAINPFEKAKLINQRAIQIEAGAYSKYSKSTITSVLAAEKEWLNGDFPGFTINRYNQEGEEQTIRVVTAGPNFSTPTK